MLLIPHCYALSESFGLPQLSHASLRWMTKHLDRFWAQKVFASLPLPQMNKCSEDVIDQLTADTVMEMLFKLDKVKNQLPPGQTSWAEPVKQLVARTQEKVLDYSIRRFKAIITLAGFEEKYLMGMGWKRDIVELLFNKMLSDVSLEHWPTFLQTTQEMLARESASEWNADACAVFKDSYSRCYNMVVANASLIVGTAAWNTMSKDLQVQIKKDAVVVDVRQRQREKPVLSSSQRPKSSSVKKTFNHHMRSHALSSSASSTSSGTTQTFGRGREEGNRSRVQGQRQTDVTHDRRGMRHVPAARTKSK
ncbi:BTB/POZ domain-containing protein 8-like [Diadema setosum]|uniref:BTB/POZ domain-containing protein 8-like n=1 Tax=Diadema setosum TaxID=31175 RepID=UPI003B3B4180